MGEWHGRKCAQFLQSLKASGDQCFHAIALGGIEVFFAEGAIQFYRLKAIIEDELSQKGMAFQVPLGRSQQVANGDFSNDEPEVQIAFGKIFDLFAADFAQITLITFGHEWISSRWMINDDIPVD